MVNNLAMVAGKAVMVVALSIHLLVSLQLWNLIDQW
jgi:hypothetical protein